MLYAAHTIFGSVYKMSKIRELVLEAIKESCLTELDLCSFIFCLTSPGINHSVPIPFKWI